MDKNEIEGFLKSEWFGRIGCYDSNKVYVVPITFAYDNGYIYSHTKDGLKISIMRKNPSVCFEIDNALSFTNWKSVIAFGNFEELHGADANQGLEILMGKLQSLLNKSFSPTSSQKRDNINIDNLAFQYSFLSPFLHNESKQITDLVVYRIKVDEITGKFGNDE